MAMICSALLAARSPPRLRRCRTVFPEDAGTGLTPHNDAKLASDCNLSGLSPAVRRSWAAPMWPIELRATRFGVSSSTRRRSLPQVRDLVMQFEVTASKGFEADAIGGIQVAICCQIRAPRGQGADELHAGKAAQLIAKTVGSADDRIVDHLQGDAPGAYRGLPASHENP